MSTITKEELLTRMFDLEHELLIKPRLRVAEYFGLDTKRVTKDTIFVLYGPHRDGFPNFIRFSMLIEKGTALMMDDPNKLKLDAGCVV